MAYREEQYRQLWAELDLFIKEAARTSPNHAKVNIVLYNFSKLLIKEVICWQMKNVFCHDLNILLNGKLGLVGKRYLCLLNCLLIWQEKRGTIDRKI